MLSAVVVSSARVRAARLPASSTTRWAVRALGTRAAAATARPDGRVVTVTSTLDNISLKGTLYEPADGTGKVPVVMLHGGGQTRHAWGATATTLAGQGHTVLSMDLRGHGDSDWTPTGEYERTRYTQDLADTITTIGRPVAVVGASLGGIIGLVSTARPDITDMMKALVLVDISPNMSPGGVARILDFMAAFPDGFESVEQAAAVVAKFQPHRKAPQQVDGLRKNLRLMENGRYKWHWDPRMLQSPDFDRENLPVLRDRMNSIAEQIAMPCLLVRGQMSDVINEEAVAEFRSRVKHAEYVDVANAAHMVAGDKNDVFTGAVLEFITKL